MQLFLGPCFIWRVDWWRGDPCSKQFSERRATSAHFGGSGDSGDSISFLSLCVEILSIQSLIFPLLR